MPYVNFNPQQIVEAWACVRTHNHSIPSEVLDSMREVLESALLKGSGQCLVGEAGSMPGTSGFTMACFKASDVPVGAQLYIQTETK